MQCAIFNHVSYVILIGRYNDTDYDNSLYYVVGDIMGLIIRRALPEDAYNYTICHISIWQSAYKEIVPDDYLNNMSNGVDQRVEKIYIP